MERQRMQLSRPCHMLQTDGASTGSRRKAPNPTGRAKIGWDWSNAIDLFGTRLARIDGKGVSLALH
jgi:hypothetical protein